MIGNLTIETLMILEDHGVTLNDMTALKDFDPEGNKMPPARIMAGVAFMAARSTDPEAKWEDAIRVPFESLFDKLGDVMGGDDNSPEA